jgi:N-formylglutamate deformylase
MSSTTKAVISFIIPVAILFAAYVITTLLSTVFNGWSVAVLNIVSGIVAITLGSGMSVAGAMANDSGKGGPFIITFQWMSLGYPLVYLTGLVSSIVVLYSEYANKEGVAVWLASMSLVWLVLIGVLLLGGIAWGNVEDSRRKRQRERRIENQRKPYLIHLPHCGTHIPDEYRGDYLLSQEKLEQNVIQYADLYTADLFEPLLSRYGGVTSKYSRLLFDPERFFDDEQETMSKFGLGWFYENAILERVPLRNTTHKAVIADYYHQHHSELNQLTQKKLDLYGRCTIIDCHSFSNERYWFQDQDVELPDICIGYDEEHADMELVEILKQAFQFYDVAINSPYSGSMVPTDFYNKDKNVKSVMIEINKRLYLDSDNKKANDYDEIYNILHRVMVKLIFNENYRVGVA